MADGQRRQIAPVRKLIAAVLGTFATFVILFGAGLGSWAIAAIGFALLVLALSLVLVTAFRGGARAWVTGIGHVHSVSEPPASSAFGRCELQLVIDAPGLPPRSVKIRDARVPVSKWPDPGTGLPIMVAVDDQRYVRILWDEVPTHAQAAAEATAPDFDGLDPLDDDLLIEEDAPPWVRRDGDEFPPRPAGDPVPERSDDPPPGQREHVVVRQTPGGTIVLEGTLVDSPPATPLPRRPSPGPYRSGFMAAGPPDQANLDLDDPGVPLGPASSEQPWNPDDDAILADLGTIEADPANDLGGPFHRVGITLLVTDLSRSVGFYRDMLGFSEIDGGEGNAVLASGPTRLVLRAIPEVAPINRRLVHLNLEVTDIDAVYDDLREKGVHFTYAPRVVNRGEKLEVWAAAFRDPDGHGIALTQWRDRRNNPARPAPPPPRGGG